MKTKLINISNETIQKIKIEKESNLKFDEEKNSYIYPENEIVMYYFEKGEEPEIYYQAYVKFGEYYFEGFGDIIKKETNINKYLEDIKQDIIEEMFNYKLEEIIEKYEKTFAPAISEKRYFENEEDYAITYNLDKIFEIGFNLDKITNIMSKEDREFLEFYKQI